MRDREGGERGEGKEEKNLFNGPKNSGAMELSSLFASEMKGGGGGGMKKKN